MKTLEEQWKFGFLLPNISTIQAVGNEYVALTHINDQRVQVLIQKQPNLQYLVKGFTDQYKRPITPGILIIREEQLRTHSGIVAVIDFRNILAICCIITTWKNFLNRGQHIPPSAGFSDYFDIYPIQPHKFDEWLITLSPAARGLDPAKDFSGQTKPEIVGQVYDPKYEPIMFQALMNEWKDHYITQKSSNWRRTALFRSLQIAYQACAMPISNYLTIYDYGSSLALWVSAFEILAHPQNGKVQKSDVLSLIADIPLQSKMLSNRLYAINLGKNKLRVNLPQKLYSQIYDSRNNFLHGEPVKIKHLFPWGKTRRYGLHLFTPLIYNLALISHLSIHDLYTGEYFEQTLIEEALMKSTIDLPKNP